MALALLQEKFNTILDDSLIKDIENVGKLVVFKKDDIIIDINQTLSHMHKEMNYLFIFWKPAKPARCL